MTRRLGDNPDAIYRAFVALSEGGVVTRQGILYPVALLPCGKVFHVRHGALACDADPSGVSVRDARPSEADAFDAALTADTLRVVVRSRPGYGSNYGTPSTLQVLHLPLQDMDM